MADISVNKEIVDELREDDGRITYQFIDAGTSVSGDYVTKTGTPANTQIAMFVDSDTLQGIGDVTWDGSNFEINGILKATGIYKNGYNIDDLYDNYGNWELLVNSETAGNGYPIDSGLGVWFKAGSNVTISRSANQVTISASGTSYTAGDGITIDGSNVISVYFDDVTIGINSSTSKLEVKDGSITPTKLDTTYVEQSAFDTWRAGVTQTEMDYLHGVTSDIQTQLDGKVKQNGPASANTLPYWSSSDGIEGAGWLMLDTSNSILKVGYSDAASTALKIQAYEGVGACYSGKCIYLYNTGTTIKLDAYDYSAGSALDFQIGGNGGRIGYRAAASSSYYHYFNGSAYFNSTLVRAGYTVVDTGYRDMKKSFQSINTSGTVSINLLNGYNAKTYSYLDGDLTISFSNLTNGDSGIVVVRHGSSSYTVTWPSNARLLENGSNSVTLESGTDKYSVFGYIYDGSYIWVNRQQVLVAT